MSEHHLQRRRIRIAVSALLALAVLVPATAAAKSTAKDDLAIQKKAVLKRSDFPKGWSSEPSGDSELPPIDACQDLQAVNEALDPLSTESPDFIKSDITRAQNSVVVLPSAKKAKSFMAPYRDDEAEACLEALVKEAFSDPSITALRVYVSPKNDRPTGADDAVGFEIQITATAAATAGQPAETAVIYFDLLVARIGRALTNFTFSNLARPLPEQAELVDVVVGRLEDADV